MLGVKIETPMAAENAEKTTRIPGSRLPNGVPVTRAFS